MKQGLTASLMVCLLAAGVAVGALALQPGGEPEAQTSATAPVPTTVSPYGGTGTGTDGSSAPAAQAVLVISDFEFTALTVEPGATVTVQNQDDFPHTVTDDDGQVSSGSVDGGATGSLVAPTTPGTYQIHCNFHPQMRGTLTVG